MGLFVEGEEAELFVDFVGGLMLLFFASLIELLLKYLARFQTK